MSYPFPPALSSAQRHRGDTRGILMPAALPRSRTPNEDFDALVLDSYQTVLDDYEEELATLDIAVDFIPRMRNSGIHPQWPEDVVADGAVPLARLLPAGVDRLGQPTRPRIIIFRMPIENRTDSTAEREMMLDYIIARLVGVYLGMPASRIAPTLDWDDPLV